MSRRPYAMQEHKTNQPIINKHGRKGGRGIRPWLLMPKVLAVGIWLGGLLCGLGVALKARATAVESNKPVASEYLEALHTIFVGVAVPALLLAIIFGITLFFQHPKQFIRLRWFQVKVVIVAIAVPVSHFVMSAIMLDLRAAVAAGQSGVDEITRFAIGLAIVFIVFAFIALLGRLKPRLGQNWAKTYKKD